MNIIPFGDIVRELRSRNRISQEELSDGICSASNLSRIENGHQVATTITAVLILQRLPGDRAAMLGFSSRSQTRFIRFQREVLSSIEKGSLDSFMEYIKKPLPKMSPFEQQRDLLIRASAKELAGNGDITDYINALEVTISLDELLAHDKKHLFYEQEIIILLNIIRHLSIRELYESAYILCMHLYDFTKLTSGGHPAFNTVLHFTRCVREKNPGKFTFIVAPEF